MSDLRYNEVLFSQEYRRTLADIPCNELRPMAEVFVRNLDRLASMAKLPANSVYWAQYAGGMGAEICHRLTGKHLSDLGEDEWRLNIDQINESVTRQIMARAVEYAEDEFYLARKAWAEGLANLATLDSYLGGTFSRGAESIISAVITGVWTAFEAMTGDLWEAALNASPDVLAKLPGKQSQAEKEQGKQISVDRLAQYGFDLRGKMGTLLRERFEFSSLDKIRSAYAAAFPVDSGISRLLIDEKSLFRLSMVRNLIVHRAGIVDEEFTGKMRKDPELSKVAKGEPLKLTGRLARDLVDPVIECGAKLIRKVDDFLVAQA